MSSAIEMTLTQLRDALAAGAVSSVEATRAYLDAIAARDGTIRAYTQVFAERALERAAAADAARAAGRPGGLLAGVPVSIKDNMCTDYGRTTCASRMLEHFAAPYTATAVRRLEDAGAIVLGKTNMDEFAMGSSTENSRLQQTTNPWDPARVPGGSSGGAAASVAGRLCAGALGSDTGGSIRLPAALCGCVGLKPTYGRVSRYGLVAFASSLDQIGPLTRTVADAALLTEVLCGHDPLDSTSVAQPAPACLAELETPVDGLRVGLVREWVSDRLDPQTHQAVDRAVGALSDQGARIVEVSLPHSRIDVGRDGALSSYAVACYYIVATAEASSNLARYDGVHYGHRTAEAGEDIVEMVSRSRAQAFGDEVKQRIMLGTYTLSSGYYDAYYLKALKVRRLIAGDFHRAFEQVDVLLGPTSPEPAFAIGAKTADPLTMYLTDVFTLSTNLAGLPAISLPAGLSREGLPLAVQLQGPVFQEPRLLRAARMIERALDLGAMIPPCVKGLPS
ncbi:MAG: Asp-tRNA(Asn)/Glu-tRNA(Gln) amidotransferase subunit GatA [Planctomycetes bacterium]|nr:Asp-tRNA(Asn)/Glu-tRNA(Gln) amidotransferase subunit GatA [Planctomycetota bacterium]